ncbi:hypothetical protein [Streptomyces sp. ME19-01-6]|uniref:hypothetical protein n=1 Tax=Streptomyces sp. ME19-01-6 TaxID=3028686 RepID=UPI00299FA701|nr:hypothetical protein [Streptomyces sp. ME19-01-6]MDX3230576.1 hypothetical protein [Streptomyces sp. ME19-01-6]
MSPDDIPTEITKLVYTCPLSASQGRSQNEVATLLAHYWPAIEQHIRQQVAGEILASGGHVVDGDTAWDSGRDREHAARIARGE